MRRLQSTSRFRPARHRRCPCFEGSSSGTRRSRLFAPPLSGRPGDASQSCLGETEMKIQIRGPGLKLTKTQRADVERRLHFALARFGKRIGRVTLRFSDANSLSGGVEKRCQIDVGMRPTSVRVEHTDIDLLVALEHAAHRAARSVARALDGEHWWEENCPRPRRWAWRR